LASVHDISAEYPSTVVCLAHLLSFTSTSAYSVEIGLPGRFAPGINTHLSLFMQTIYVSIHINACTCVALKTILHQKAMNPKKLNGNMLICLFQFFSFFSHFPRSPKLDV